MNNFLIKLFIKDSQNIKNEKVRTSYGNLASTAGIVSNLILFLIKFSIGTIYFSVSIIADAVNNLADCASSVVTLVGFKLSSKPADEKHPFGHARIEYICGIIVSFIIMIIGYELFKSSIDKIINPVMPNITGLVFIGLVFALILKLWQAVFYKKIGKLINSQTLIATSTDSRNDCLSTTTVIIGAIIMSTTGVNVDAYLGIALAIFIIYSGIKLVMETAAPLLGEAPDSELIEEIKNKVKNYDEVLGIHDLVVHSYGVGKYFATMHCELDCNQDIVKSHELIDDIEEDFKQNMGIDMVLHMDPIDNSNPKTLELKKNILKKINSKFSNSNIHDFRVAWGKEHSNVVFDVTMPFSEKMSDTMIEEQIREMLHEIDKRLILKITIDRGK